MANFFQMNPIARLNRGLDRERSQFITESVRVSPDSTFRVQSSSPSPLTFWSVWSFGLVVAPPRLSHRALLSPLS